MKTNYSESTVKVNGETLTLYRVENDINGNPRYVLHFLDILSKDEQAALYEETIALKKASPNEWIPFVRVAYEAAIAKARKVGGKVYRAKWFGGGIVFQSYNMRIDLENVLAA